MLNRSARIRSTDAGAPFAVPLVRIGAAALVSSCVTVIDYAALTVRVNDPSARVFNAEVAAVGNTAYQRLP